MYELVYATQPTVISGSSLASAEVRVLYLPIYFSIRPGPQWDCCNTSLQAIDPSCQLTKSLPVWKIKPGIRSATITHIERYTWLQCNSWLEQICQRLQFAPISSRVDYCNSVLYGMWSLSSSNTVGSECGCTTHHRQEEIWSHYQHHTWWPPLAPSETTYRVQAVLHSQQVSSSHCTILSGGSVYSGIGDDRVYTSTFVFTWWPDNTAL